jgi:hypothetical protein
MGPSLSIPHSFGFSRLTAPVVDADMDLEMIPMKIVNKAVFLPASDELLNDEALSDGELVPFQIDYLAPKRDRKPSNWITPSTYDDAMARLRTATAIKAVVKSASSI